MRLLLDFLYLLGALLLSPLWLTRMIRTGKLATDWPARFGRVRSCSELSSPRLLIHAVSVGEVNATRLLVRELSQALPELDIVIATTTDTGYARAVSIFSENHTVVRYPLDFSFAVNRFLDAIQPDAVALVELEVWPNFTTACQQRGIPVCVVNGRLSERSYCRYRRIRRLIAPYFRTLAFAAVQSRDYAQRFESLGVASDDIHVTGTMKWDTAEIADDVPGSEALAAELGIDRTRPLVVAGSTAPDEHALLVSAVPEGVQLLCAPRRPEWSDQAAADLPGCARRSRNECTSAAGRFLLDTIGELRQAYALADVVVVGRSFGNLHGSDMIEPIALGKPTIVGPAVSDFQQIMEALLDGDGIRQTDAGQLAAVIQRLLDDQGEAAALAERGRAVIRANQGATTAHCQLIGSLLPNVPPKRNSPFQRVAETAKEKKEERTF